MKHRLLCQTAIATTLLAAPAIALAQDKATDVDTVVATASLTGGVDRELIGGSASIISRIALEERQTRQLVDVLRDVPGVEVSRAGGLGGMTQVRIRGLEANHTLTLVDGIELSSPVGREVDFTSLMVEDGGRVEVLRGQQSSLYGSEAIGGVIQYFTPDGRTSPGVRGRLEYGGFDTLNGSVTLGGARDGFDYALSASGYDTEGTANTRSGTRRLGYYNATSSAKVGYDFGEGLRLTGVVRAARTEAEYNGDGDGQGVLIDDTSRYATNTVVARIGLEGAAMDGRWTHNLAAQGADVQYDDFHSVFGNSDSRGRRTKSTYITAFTFGGDIKQKLTGSLDFERETMQQSNDPTSRRLETRSITAVYDAVIGDRTAFGVAVRQDDPGQFQSYTSYRAQVTHKLDNGTRLRAAAGSGIQYPNAYELYGYFGSYAPNPNLKPEISEGWEIGVEQDLRGGDVLIGATWFDNDLTNQITALGFPVTQPVNSAAKTHLSGVELFAEASLGEGWRINAAYTWLDAPVNGRQAVRRARNIASLNVSWRSMSEDFGVNFNVRYNGDQNDTQFLNVFPFSAIPVTLPAFTLVNLSGDWKLTDKVSLYARVDNLLDQTYEEAFSYRGAGREAFVGLKARF